MAPNRGIHTLFAASVLMLTAAAHAVVVNVPAETLDNISPGLLYTYTGLDGAGTAMTAQASAGGAMNAITSGSYQGLWFGGNQGSATYSFTFSSPVSYFDIHINAMSTLNQHVETIGGFTLDSGASPSFAFTDYGNSAWDGATVTSGPADNGDFRLAISVGPGESFSSVSFYHFQSGVPNGSVVRDINFELAVPEPSSYALLLLGLGFIIARARRRP